MKYSYSAKRLLLLIVMLTVVVSSSAQWQANAAVNVPDNIRAALFINTGASGTTSLTSAATLQSAGGMKLVWRDPAFSFTFGSVAPGQTVRFAMDGYRALLLETSSLGNALSVLKKVQAGSSAAFVTQLTKSGKTVYQVSEGVYASAAAATSALAKWKSADVTSGIQSSLSARVAGPWAVESGPYASLAEAKAAVEKISGAGLDAFAAIKPSGSKLSYVVRVGQEIDEAAAAKLAPAVTKAGGVKVKTASGAEGYAVIRNDATGGEGTATLYAVPADRGVSLRAEPAGEAGIQVSERSQRTYRGSMELSVYNGALAVINDVDLEKYLYAVVGAEIGASWPHEAQKAQAVASRSYALASGMAYKIAHVVDTTASQAYYGIGSENDNSTAGVEATRGEVLVMSNGRILAALYSASAGGITADPTEGWGNPDNTMAGAVKSPDEIQQRGKLSWFRVATSEGAVGYMREDLLDDGKQKNKAGLPLLTVNAEGSNMRARPTTTSSSLGTFSQGTSMVMLGLVDEETSYSWVTEPQTASQMLDSLKKRDASLSGPLYTLEVSKRGPSGRAIEIAANGAVVGIDKPDYLRSAMGGLRSTLFGIEETGRMSVLSGNRTTRELPRQTGELYTIDGNGKSQAIKDGNLFILDGKGNLRTATSTAQFVMTGKGYGHGIGMSQWGTWGLAEQGYDYQAILLYYYNNVTIEKGANG